MFKNDLLAGQHVLSTGGGTWLGLIMATHTVNAPTFTFTPTKAGDN